LERGAKRRVWKRRVFSDFFVVQKGSRKNKSKDFLERQFFVGEVVRIYVRLTHPPIRAHPNSSLFFNYFLIKKYREISKANMQIDKRGFTQNFDLYPS